MRVIASLLRHKLLPQRLSHVVDYKFTPEFLFHLIPIHIDPSFRQLQDRGFIHKMRFDNLTIDEIDRKYPDILYPSKDALLDAASHLIEFMQILKKEEILRTTLVGLTGGLAVMHHCPDRLPSIVSGMDYKNRSPRQPSID